MELGVGQPRIEQATSADGSAALRPGQAQHAQPGAAGAGHATS